MLKTKLPTSEKPNIQLLDRQKDTKIKFLQEQNSNLRAQIKDLEENLKLNKESLSLLLKKDPFCPMSLRDLNVVHKKNSNHLGEIKLEETNEINNFVRSLQKIIERLTKENENHLENIRNLIKERNHAQTKALINELISDETQNNENEMITELRDRILFLQGIVNQKERNEDLKLEKKSEDVIVCKSVIENPDERVMKLYKELQSVKNTLFVVCKKYDRVKSQQKDLLSLNYTLFMEINRLKERSIQSRNYETEPGNSKDTEYFHDTTPVRTKFMKETDENCDENELSPANSPFPPKIITNFKKRGMAKHSQIPKLDLTTAKKIQETNARRNIPPKNLNQLNKSAESGSLVADQTEKIKKLESELLRVKKLLQFEMINHNRMEEKCERCMKEKDVLREKIETLKTSQREYERKWEKIHQYLNFYREFYFKSIFHFYKEKISSQKMDNDLTQLNGIDTVQNRIMEKKSVSNPLKLREISMEDIKNQFSNDSSHENSLLDKENTFVVKGSPHSFSELPKKGSYSDVVQNETPHINNLPGDSCHKVMTKYLDGSRRVSLKKRASKSQVFDYRSAMKILGKEKKIRKKVGSVSNIGNDINEEIEIDYGKKIGMNVERRLISPLSKSINEKNDFCFLSKNNLKLKKNTQSMNLGLNEELFV